VTGATTWQEYEAAIQNMYGGPASFSARQFQVVVDGELVNGVADNVTTIGGNSVAVEAKFVDNWASSIYNPASPVGSMQFAADAQAQMLSQAQAYSTYFDQVIYHSNSPGLIQYYSSVFQNAGIQNINFILTK
jgi:filamentous hemagglutinin